MSVAIWLAALACIDLAAVCFCAAAGWRRRATGLRAELDARDALCRDRRCRLGPAPAPIPFFPDPLRPRGRPQETSRPG